MSEISPYDDDELNEYGLRIRCKELRAYIAELQAARRAYASEFDPVNGEPDVGSIHENIRKLKKSLNSALEQVSESRTRRFPVYGAGFSIPWATVEPFEDQAQKNHGQSLSQLAERGGLAPQELWCIINGKTWRECTLTHSQALEWARSLIMPSADKLRRELDLVRLAGAVLRQHTTECQYHECACGSESQDVKALRALLETYES